MKKDSLRGMIVAFVTLAIYHLIVFLIPFDKNTTFWVSYSFTLVAFAVVIASIYIAFIHKPDAKSRFYGFPIARIGVVYGTCQLIASFVIMALGQWITFWIAVLLYAIGLGVAVIGLVSADSVVEQICGLDDKLKMDTTMMRALQSKVSQIAAQYNHDAIIALADEMRYSDPVSSSALAEAEADLAAMIDQLQAAVVDGDYAVVGQLCQKASSLLAERNRLCKLNKN